MSLESLAEFRREARPDVLFDDARARVAMLADLRERRVGVRSSHTCPRIGIPSANTFICKWFRQRVAWVLEVA